MWAQESRCLPVSEFDDFDEFGPSNPSIDSLSGTERATTEPVASALLMVRSCNRIGLQASPRPGICGWLWRR